jgi:hypothetical protein
MVQIKELRLGNWVAIAEPSTEELSHNQIQRIDEHIFPLILEHPETYFPIPITSDLVEKCGFEPTKETWMEHKAASLYVQENSGFWYFAVYDPTLGAYWKPMKSLHQLQNLYFALTGKELKIEL